MLDTLLGGSPAVQRLQLGAARRLFAAGLDANRATVLGGVLGVMAGLALGSGARAAGLALLLASVLLDALDGTIARHCQHPTTFGGVLDLSMDRVVEVAVLLGICWRRPELYLPALVLAATWYVNITVFLAVGSALERKGPRVIEYPPGILERGEAILFFVLLAISGGFAATLCWLFSLLEVVTAGQRLVFGWRAIT